MNEQKEIFITSATLKRPDGTVEQLSDEEAQGLIRPGNCIALLDGRVTIINDSDITITWIEGTPEQILAIRGIDLL